MRANARSETPTGCRLCGAHRTLLRMTPCHCDNICESCVWQHWARDDNRLRIVECPHCSAAFDPEATIAIAQVEALTRDVHKRQESLQRFQDLPDSPRKGNIKGKAFPLSALWKINLGTCKEQRTNELLRAAETNHAVRLMHVLEAGADVDAANDYGQTCAFLACWRGNLSVLRVLRAWGAHMALPANGGAYPWHACVRGGHQECAAFLEQHGYGLAYAPPPAFAPHAPGDAPILIDPAVDHPGAGSFMIDDAFGDDFLTYLTDAVLSKSPLAPPSSTKPLRNDRAYFCDADGIVRAQLQQLLQTHGPFQQRQVMAYMQMRFLLYTERGSILPPHSDLSRTDPDTHRSSTHTFILYLSDADGATALLETLPDKCSEVVALCEVLPRKGRLLIFPHACPHEGREVRSSAKILLRGEVWVSDV